MSLPTPSSPQHSKLPWLKRFSTSANRLIHLSSSLTDAILPTTHSSTSPTDDDQVSCLLSAHRRRILGAVPDRWPMYSNLAHDYLLGLPIGFGASSVVRIARFKPRNAELCAVKIIDIDRLSLKQVDYLRRETLLMSLAKHPNVLRVRGEWIDDTSLCIAMRLMKAGSLADIIRYRYQDGLPEPVIATALIQAIAGLEYLHSNGWIHRDLKAANLLVDDDGTVLLADFGVCVGLNLDPATPTGPIPDPPSDAPGSLQGQPMMRKRPSLVGTALFMAPEVVQQQAYDDRVDIWSFGITALELALGKAPHASSAPARVLMKTVSEPSPTLDRQRPGAPHGYSKTFKAFVDRCLQKLPALRPTSRELLCDERFFRKARPKSYLVQTILIDLPRLEERQERQCLERQESNRNFSVGWDFDEKFCDEKVGGGVKVDNRPIMDLSEDFNHLNE